MSNVKALYESMLREKILQDANERLAQRVKELLEENEELYKDREVLYEKLAELRRILEEKLT